MIFARRYIRTKERERGWWDLEKLYSDWPLGPCPFVFRAHNSGQSARCQELREIIYIYGAWHVCVCSSSLMMMMMILCGSLQASEVSVWPADNGPRLYSSAALFARLGYYTTASFQVFRVFINNITEQLWLYVRLFLCETVWDETFRVYIRWHSTSLRSEYEQAIIVRIYFYMRLTVHVCFYL